MRKKKKKGAYFFARRLGGRHNLKIRATSILYFALILPYFISFQARRYGQANYVNNNTEADHFRRKRIKCVILKTESWKSAIITADSWESADLRADSLTAHFIGDTSGLLGWNVIAQKTVGRWSLVSGSPVIGSLAKCPAVIGHRHSWGPTTNEHKC